MVGRVDATEGCVCVCVWSRGAVCSRGRDGAAAANAGWEAGKRRRRSRSKVAMGADCGSYSRRGSWPVGWLVVEDQRSLIVTKERHGRTQISSVECLSVVCL